jgi:hypothetical protein
MPSSRPNRTTSDRTGTTRVSASPNSTYDVGLISDCYDCVKFLNKLPMGVLEESMQVFRQNIFNMAERKQIPTRIY